MYRSDSSQTWSISVSNDIRLNFSVYVGCKFGFISKEANLAKATLWPKPQESNPDGSLIEQWENWWNELIQNRSIELNAGIINTSDELFDYPEFNNLKYSGLIQYCKKSWQEFYDWWGMPAGGGLAMAYWESNIDATRHVYEFEKTKKRKVKNFRLDIDLIYNGLAKRIEPRPDYVIMPLDPSQLNDKNWWFDKLEQIG